MPRSSQTWQQQTAECRLGSGVREEVEAAVAWLPVAWREGDSDNSKIGAVEEGGQSFPSPRERMREKKVPTTQTLHRVPCCHGPRAAVFQLLRVLRGLKPRSIDQRAHVPVVL